MVHIIIEVVLDGPYSESKIARFDKHKLSIKLRR